MIVCSQYGPPWNEGEKNIAHVLADALDPYGFEPSVCWNERSVGTAPVRHRVSPTRLAAQVRWWAQAARAARQRRVTIIHLLSSISSGLGLKCFVFKRLSGAALVLHVTGLSRPVRGYKTLLCADRILVGGAYLTPFFPDAVEIPPLSPHIGTPAHQARRRPTGKHRRILYLGAMEPVRGVHTLIEAMALLKTVHRRADVSVTLAWNGYGDARYQRRVKSDIERYDLESCVRWEGVVSDVSALYQEHDLVVIPRASPERMGFPLRLLEALSHGKPVVVSDVCEMPRVVDGCGAVFRAEDAGSLAAAIDRLLTDPVLYRRCVDRARERAREYDQTDTVRKVVDVYERLMDRTGLASRRS